jgi:hypothetical protein
MKKVFLIIVTILLCQIGFSQTFKGGQKWDLPTYGYGIDTIKPLIIQNQNGNGGAGLYIVVGTDTCKVWLDSIGNAHFESDSVLFTTQAIKIGGYAIDSILNQDDLSSNSSTAIPTQQSVKSYVDNHVSDSSGYADNSALLEGNTAQTLKDTIQINGTWYGQGDVATISTVDLSRKSILYRYDGTDTIMYGKLSLDNAASYARLDSTVYLIEVYADSLTPTTQLLVDGVTIIFKTNTDVYSNKTYALFIPENFTKDVYVFGHAIFRTKDGLFNRYIGTTPINIYIECAKATSSGALPNIDFTNLVTGVSGIVTIKSELGIFSTGGDAFSKSTGFATTWNLLSDFTSSTNYGINAIVPAGESTIFNVVSNNVLGNTNGLSYYSNLATSSQLNFNVKNSNSPIVNLYQDNLSNPTDAYLNGTFTGSNIISFTNNTINGIFEVSGKLLGTLNLSGISSSEELGLIKINSNLGLSSINSDETYLNVEFNGLYIPEETVSINPGTYSCFKFNTVCHPKISAGEESVFTKTGSGTAEFTNKASINISVDSPMKSAFILTQGTLEIDCKIIRENTVSFSSISPLIRQTASSTYIQGPNAFLNNKCTESGSVLGGNCFKTNGLGIQIIKGGVMVSNDTVGCFTVVPSVLSDTIKIDSVFIYTDYVVNKEFTCPSTVTSITPFSSKDWASSPDTFSINVNDSGVVNIPLNANCTNVATAIAHINSQLVAYGVTTVFAYAYPPLPTLIWLSTNTAGGNTSITVKNVYNTPLSNLGWRAGTTSNTIIFGIGNGGTEVYNTLIR